MVRTNNGGKLCGKEFDQPCKQHDIDRENKTPYMPQNNGFSKRMNKTLIEKARSMLTDAYPSHDY